MYDIGMLNAAIKAIMPEVLTSEVFYILLYNPLLYVVDLVNL